MSLFASRILEHVVKGRPGKLVKWLTDVTAHPKADQRDRPAPNEP
jgi:hypothetical protein